MFYYVVIYYHFVLYTFSNALQRDGREWRIMIVLYIRVMNQYAKIIHLLAVMVA